MKLVSVNVGEPRLIETPNGKVLTSIFKEPVEGRRQIVPHNVEGDRQADLSVHGGPKKAIYAYALDHYPYWTKELADSKPFLKFDYGMFGENLTVEGLLETNTHIGDLFQLGTAHLRVTQPRMPCFKLALRLERSDMVKRFWKSGLSGIYFSIEQAGDIGAGDELRLLEADRHAVSIADVVGLYKGESDDAELFQRVLAAPIAGSWRQHIQERWIQ